MEDKIKLDYNLFKAVCICDFGDVGTKLYLHFLLPNDNTDGESVSNLAEELDCDKLTVAENLDYLIGCDVILESDEVREANNDKYYKFTINESMYEWENMNDNYYKYMELDYEDFIGYKVIIYKDKKED